jgi:hypothetical protein
MSFSKHQNPFYIVLPKLIERKGYFSQILQLNLSIEGGDLSLHEFNVFFTLSEIGL